MTTPSIGMMKPMKSPQPSIVRHTHRLLSLAPVAIQHNIPRRMSAMPLSSSGPGAPILTNRRHSSSHLNSARMNYQNSLFGQYREDLSNFRRKEAEKQRLLAGSSSRQSPDLKKDKKASGRTLLMLRSWFRHDKGDLLMLAILAISMAVLSFVYDRLTTSFYHLRDYLTTELTTVFIYNFFIWIAFVVVMICLAAIVTRYIAPQAAGSGVAEMRVVVRGVVLKEYLSFKTLIAKVVGNILVLGSGLPMGKEGPFVHICAIAATQLMKLLTSIPDISEYESKYFEIIAVACGLGVAVTFASPVGGVLYSIEIVTAFFSVRSYWLGFFAATVGALFWRLLMVWSGYETNISHIFRTSFRLDNPYESWEIVTYLLLGILCGLAAVCFIIINEKVILFNRRKSRFNRIHQRFPFLYVIALSTMVGAISYPGLLGRYYASWLNSEESIRELFSNFTWNSMPPNASHYTDEILHNWSTPNTSVFFHLFLFSIMNLVIVSVCCTLPVPAGIIVPSFKIGAGIGRFYGEGITWLFNEGINPFNNRTEYPILAGTYAMAGAAAFTGANTGALSSAVIIFETCGQVTHMIPIIMSVLASTMVARLFKPSFYDNSIILKKLPYLPSHLPPSSNVHRIFVEDFMAADILFIYDRCTYRYLRHLLNVNLKLRTFPFVKSPENMILLGTVERSELQALLDNHISRKRMLAELRKSIQDLASHPASPTCPIHGSEPTLSFVRSFERIAEDVEVSVSPIGSAAWEEMQLDETVDFTDCPIDPAPFQLIEGTSLVKCHSMFNLVGIQTAYVTSLGTLVGVVSLKELRTAIEGMNTGVLPRKVTTMVESNKMKVSDIEEEAEEEDVFTSNHEHHTMDNGKAEKGQH